MQFVSIYKGELKPSIAKGHNFDRVVTTSSNEVFTIQTSVEVNEKGLFSKSKSFFEDIVEIKSII
jgi:hypothetical protein